jgi:hypothetical protein
MKQRRSVSQVFLVRLCCWLLLPVMLSGCENKGNVSSTDNRSSSSSGSRVEDNGGASSQTASDDGGSSSSQQSAGSKAEEVCRKYDSCGCQKFEQCIAEIGNDPSIAQAGIGDCMLKSSCQSLCSGHPDGCPKTNTAGGSPPKSNCSAISCSKNSDCPSDCFGGCDGVICYAF